MAKRPHGNPRILGRARNPHLAARLASTKAPGPSLQVRLTALERAVASSQQITAKQHRRLMAELRALRALWAPPNVVTGDVSFDIARHLKPGALVIEPEPDAVEVRQGSIADDLAKSTAAIRRCQDVLTRLREQEEKSREIGGRIARETRRQVLAAEEIQTPPTRHEPRLRRLFAWLGELTQGASR